MSERLSGVMIAGVKLLLSKSLICLHVHEMSLILKEELSFYPHPT